MTMKVLILHRKDVANPEAGGGTLDIQKMASFLAKRGHEVTLMCARPSGGKNEDVIDGMRILRVGNKYSVYLLAPLYYIRKFRNKTDVLIDVINGPSWFSPFYSKTPKIAIMFQTFRDVFWLEINKFSAAFLCLIERIIPRIYHKIPVVTPSPSVRDELVSLGFPKENIFVVPPGIDLEMFKPGEKSSFPLVLYVGRLKKYKGLEYLVIAMKYVVKDVPNARLLIVGKGDYEKELREFVEKMNLEDVVEFCGYVSEERKVELMQKAHVLVLPSIKEGWGIPIIEAAACGTPAIGTDTTGLRDSIINGKTGFLVPYGKPKILAERIIEILKNNELRNRLSENALRWVRNFSQNKLLLKTEAIIRKLKA